MNTPSVPADPSSPNPLPLLLTQGDVCGIGPEIIMAAAGRGELAGVVVLGDVDVLRRAAGCLRSTDDGPRQPIAVLDDLSDLAEVPPGALAVLPMRTPIAGLADLPWGRIDARAGQAAAACIREAVAQVMAGRAAGIVTAPIHKEALFAAGEPYPGHTEMLADLGGHDGRPADVRMMLANDELKTVLVTVHCALREAIERVTTQAVLSTLRIAHRTAAQWGQPAPRIGVAGLNPHAGEGGLFGREEIDIIAPAIAAAQAEGIAASGPHAPDTVFMRARRGEFDIVLAMYHDQGLIPVKYLGVEQGVNVTLGLPFVRTSPDHGTAFDLAGTGRADPASLIAAVHMARRLLAGS
ncbi:4-hydroxythreonine-4-phosphate dehydrogenase [Leptothrix cholodnii SP-6]|uniref:4-hydroxythreonine-4-phosphate dehydrogenase n=1 Tax=Leptothrix cholodnii (strain ATCC 51168 / LMG 8142 / SP-6) TaxID=395495 RepID=B1XX98_LEPCP|nr:4-hydroxythreonine-4-phosphate dehydrogenase PdxA [Leptothrix cholodnii]ACB33879.1 4-hydroxythreonine-4-phosphate dehydrogenase [Leptothrix cholodnii SP-6]